MPAKRGDCWKGAIVTDPLLLVSCLHQTPRASGHARSSAQAKVCVAMGRPSCLEPEGTACGASTCRLAYPLNANMYRTLMSNEIQCVSSVASVLLALDVKHSTCMRG